MNMSVDVTVAVTRTDASVIQHQNNAHMYVDVQTVTTAVA